MPPIIRRPWPLTPIDFSESLHRKSLPDLDEIRMSSMANSSFKSPIVRISDSRIAMGDQAASGIANEIRECLLKQPGVRVVFAAAPSQSEMLAALCGEPGIDWTRVTAFHMDEYIGLAHNSPQRFGKWLRSAIFDHLPFAAVHLMSPGEDAERSAAEYAAKLNEAPIDVGCCGIGVNGHLAFNDPPADFEDSRIVKLVALDSQCRQQQVDDRCFATLNEVPTHALTMTVPALLSAREIICTVPGRAKREAVRCALLGPLDPMCPASALRRHPRCTVYLDQDSSSGLRESR
jgi:glucosamine-6-phosphate deaminase